MKRKILNPLFAVLMVFTASPVLFAQSWLMTKTEELQGDYGALARTLETTNNEQVLLEILQQPGTENELLYLKNLACKRLATHGTTASVPTLVKMLENERTAHYARFALEPIPGEEVDKALWEATKTLKGLLLVGVIDSIAIRKHPESQPVLYGLIMGENAPGKEDAEVARAVASALGSLCSGEVVEYFGNADAVASDLKEPHRGFEKEIADAAFHCAEIVREKGRTEDALKIYRMIQSMEGIRNYSRESAVYHEILTLGDSGADRLVELIRGENPRLFMVAQKVARELPPGEVITKTLLAEIERMKNPSRKAQLILAVGDRTDAASKSLSRAALAELARSEDTEVRIAAIEALKNVGDPSILDTLIACTTDPEPSISQTARTTLAEIPGKEVDDAIIKLLSSRDLNTQKIAINLVQERRIIPAFAELRKYAESSDAEVKRAALSAISEVVTLADLSILVDVLAEAKTPEEIEANQWALNAACSRMPKEEVAKKVVEFIAKADERVKPNLMEILMQIGGETAVAAVSDYAWNGSPRMQNKATELLGKWKEPADINRVAELCLKVAKEAPNDRFKTRGLRGYIRFPRQFDMEENQRLEMVKTYLALAKRAEDKRLVFQVFTKYPSAKMLQEAMGLVNDPELRQDACDAAVAVADKLQSSSEETAVAMKKVIEITNKAATKDHAQRILGRQ